VITRTCSCPFAVSFVVIYVFWACAAGQRRRSWARVTTATFGLCTLVRLLEHRNEVRHVEPGWQGDYNSDCTPFSSWRAITIRWTWLVPS
jgi:hypothetical protein